MNEFLENVYAVMDGAEPYEDWSNWFDTENYNADCSPKFCSSCGHDQFKDVVKDTTDGHPCEISIHCSSCDANVAYWAYGWYDPGYANMHPTEGP